MSGHRKSCYRSVLAALGLLASTVLLAGCTDSANWVSPTLVQPETNVFEEAASSETGGDSGDTGGAGSVSSGSTLASSQGDLTIWVAQGSEFSELALETLEIATGWTIEQQILSVSELQEAVESLSASQAESSTEQSDTASSTASASTNSGVPDLILGVDENILSADRLSSGEAEQYGTDYVCVLALSEYFSANNMNEPTSWSEILLAATSVELEIVDPEQDLSSLSFVTALQDAGLWSEVESLLTVVDSYPDFQLEVGLTGAPEVQDAVDNALSQSILRIASLSQANTTNNLGTDAPLSVVPQTCVARPVYALAQTDSGQELLDYLSSQSGQNLLEQFFGLNELETGIAEDDLLAAFS